MRFTHLKLHTFIYAKIQKTFPTFQYFSTFEGMGINTHHGITYQTHLQELQ
jgi:hypothetical protein